MLFQIFLVIYSQIELLRVADNLRNRSCLSQLTIRQFRTYSATATKSKMATPRFKKSFW